jgi:plasmid stabilization system protein ParE
MRIDFHGLVFETSRISFYLWSPWRASALENRLFEAVRQAIGKTPEQGPDELHLHVAEPRQWRSAWQALVRVLKGWQEEAEAGSERRSWRWLLEGDTDDHGYDHYGEPLSLWVYLRLSLDRGGPAEQERGEDVELDGFGIRVWAEKG